MHGDLRAGVSLVTHRKRSALVRIPPLALMYEQRSRAGHQALSAFSASAISLLAASAGETPFSGIERAFRASAF